MLKKVFINIFVVLVFLFIADYSIGYILNDFYFKEKSGLHYRTTYSIDSTTENILIFGSSFANHHYIPKIFEDSLELSTYNTGRDGLGVFYQEALVRAITKRYSPKILLVDFSDSFEYIESDYDRLSTLLPYYKKHSEFRDIIYLKSKFERIKLISQVYPFNSQILTIGIGNLELNKKRKEDFKGYVPLYGTIDSVIRKTQITKSSVDTNKTKSLLNIIKIAKSKDIKLVFVISPQYRLYNKNYNYELIREICNNNQVALFDFSEDTSIIKKQYFKDVYHLNHTGAIVFSRKVATQLNAYLKKVLVNNSRYI